MESMDKHSSPAPEKATNTKTPKKVVTWDEAIDYNDDEDADDLSLQNKDNDEEDWGRVDSVSDRFSPFLHLSLSLVFYTLITFLNSSLS